jgi:two-component system, LuxR family, response regulator FixJ
MFQAMHGEPDPAALPLTGMQIHIVDDDADLGDSLSRILGLRTGASVKYWGSCAEFCEAMPGMEPALLIVDHHMPTQTGLDLLKAIAGDPRFVAIVMTGAPNIPLVVDAIRAGAVQLLQKPFKIAELISTLEGARSQLELLEPVIAARAKLDRLSAREREVLDGIVAGYLTKEIAYRLGISPRTAEVYRGNIYLKLGVTSVGEAVTLLYTARRELPSSLG